MKGDTFCTNHGISKIDILKTDTEGHDLSVLGGFSSMLAQGNVAAVVVECGRDGDHTHSSLPGILHLLEPYGMKFSGVFETCHFANGRCEYTNALFTRNSWKESHLGFA